MDDFANRSLERYLAFDAFGHELELVANVLLEVAIGRPAGHRSHRAHAAIALVSAPLVQERLARSLLRTGEERSDHYGGGSGRERLGNVTAGPNAAIGNNRDVASVERVSRRHDRGQLRHSDPRDDARRAD